MTVRNHTWCCSALGALLLLACGRVTDTNDIASSGGAAGGGGTSGSGGASGSGGSAPLPSPTVPPNHAPPEWPADAPVDDAPWGTNAFCSPFGGYLNTADLLSTPTGVYASVFHTCESLPCDDPGLRRSLYFNAGDGWRTVYANHVSPPAYLAGLLSGTLITYWPAAAARVSPTGSVSFLDNDGVGLKAIVHGDAIYSLMYRDRQTLTVVLSRYQADTRTELTTLDSVADDFSILDDSAYVPDTGRLIQVALSSGEKSYVDAPPAKYDEVEVLPDGLVLSSDQPELTIWRGGEWSSIALDHTQELHLATTASGEVYATDHDRLLHVVNDEVVTLLELDGDQYFDKLVSTVDGGLLMGIVQVDLEDPCAALRLVWYDGATFHPL